MYRGFLLTFMTDWFGSGPAAAVVVAVAFALMHGIQDTLAIAAAFIQGLLLAVPVLAFGSLLPSMVAHAILDAFSGLLMIPLLRRWGTLDAVQPS